MQPKQHGPLRILTFSDELFAENTYLLWHAESKACVIVDPGFPPAPDHALAATQHRQLQLNLSAIWLTHGHTDHIAGIPTIRALHPNVPIHAPLAEAHFLTDPEANLSANFGTPITVPAPEVVIKPGETVTLANTEWLALDVAGHSPGGLAYYCEAAGVALVGDALFASAIGRTDFAGSSLDVLLNNIRKNLLSLPEETVLYPGHGPVTTIGEERDNNPFLQRGFEA